MTMSGKCAIEAQVGLIIDLTNSWRYYDLEEVTCLGVAHIKIKCRGRGEVKQHPVAPFMQCALTLCRMR